LAGLILNQARYISSIFAGLALSQTISSLFIQSILSSFIISWLVKCVLYIHSSRIISLLYSYTATSAVGSLYQKSSQYPFSLASGGRDGITS
jgi:hypothetical protein